MNLYSKQIKRSRPNTPFKSLFLASLLGLLLAMVPGQVSAQGAANPANAFSNQSFNTPDVQNEEKILDFFPELWKKDQKTPTLQLLSIDPAQGPTSGETRVLIRGGPFSKWQQKYLHPMCKFGDQVVTGEYVTCPQNITAIHDKDYRGRFVGYRCIQCENSPKVEFAQNVPLSVTLVGDFSDCDTKLNFEYYPPTSIDKIFPRYGPKDGDTPVQVWGRHFKEFGTDNTLCGFGTRTTKAQVFNDTYLECRSPPSDVVEKPIPFTISLNKQQNSRDTLYFWYYNFPTIEALVPDRGPEDGGTVITLHGRNFFPFKDYLDQIDNSIDTWCAFPDLKKRIHAFVTNSTTATCVAPPADSHTQTKVEITLNGVEYTEDENIFYYYKPPTLFDVTPRMGPVRGGTTVLVTGSNFEDTGEIQCDFQVGVVAGKYLSNSEIECVSPPAPQAGYVPLRVSLRKGLWSSPFKYLYYDSPVITNAQPTCGPESGFTQIEVTGKNFVDLGRNTALCIFNETIYTNATVFSENQLYCDSPPFEDDQGIPLLNKNGPNGNFYNVKVTIDGGRERSAQSFKFQYYRQPSIIQIQPNQGPIEGGTVVLINATDINQQERCGLTIRLGPDEYTPIKRDNGQLEVTTHSVFYPGPVPVEVSYNNQQFSKMKVAHSKDPKSTFWYHVQPMAAYHHPNSGPWTGQTPIVIDGIGFKPFEEEELAGVEGVQNNLYIRYASLTDPHGPLVEDQQVEKTKYTNEQVFLTSPSQPPGQKSLIQLSFNKQNWLTVKSPKLDYSFTWYDTPHVTQVSPPFGPVKNPKPLMITVSGTNFVCPDSACKYVKCRFGEPPHSAIYVEGEMTNEGKIQCLAPVYVQPDILRLEVTLNDVDYSHDNKTFGYFDPYIIDAQPRLLHVDGSTKVTIKGLGFVDSGETKAMYANPDNPLQSTDGVIKNAEFLDKNHLKTTTLPQDKLVYTSSGKSVMWDGFYIEASVYNNEFTDNRIMLHYFENPIFNLYPEKSETPANIPDELFIDMKFNPRDLLNFVKYGNFKCRFQSSKTTIIVDADFIHTPIVTGAENYSTYSPNTVYCKTPFWPIDEAADKEPVKLDISVNGQHFSGGLDFTFTRKLLIHRDVPMAGPLSGYTDTLLIGQSFRALKANKEYSAKWGPISTDPMKKAEISDYAYTKEGYENTIPGSEEITAYWYEATSIPRVDTTMDSSQKYTSVYHRSPPILNAKPYAGNTTYTTHYGGPWYVEVGVEKIFDLETQLEANATQTTFTYHDYIPSSVEFYEYKKETLISIRPTRGLSKGGTSVEVVGWDFRYMPEYGLVPHCKFGDKIVRAKFDSNVRLVCVAPANDDISTVFAFEVSTNGVDWTNSGLKFQYYEEPILNDVFPDGGDSRGGTDVYFLGAKFTNITDRPQEFNCKFTPTTIKAQPKIMPAVYVNNTAITCKTPGGWSKGDRMNLQITFNGVDYDEHGFTFVFYHIQEAFPRSGPSNGLGGDILISGEGFRAEQVPKCRLNKVVTDPISVTWNQIRCPMLPHPAGPTFFGEVDFAITANGQDWFEFEDGFQYYEQPIVLDIYPKQGPASGIGIINFYGSGFRADFGLAKLGCKIGNSVGQAFFVSKNQVSCVVEDMETVAEGDRLPARVALNSYSWTDTVEEESGSTFYVPYSVTVIYPQDGPVSGGTQILIQGTGFIDNDNVPRCKFGTKSNYVIVEAEILSYYRMTCRTPEGYVQKEPAEYPADVPFSVALLADSFEPWTDTGHKFRFFKQPIISKVEPNEVEVGQITSVTVSIDPELTGASNIFFEPIPAAMQQFNHDAGEDVGPTLAQFSYIICGWGRFGETRAVYLNQTHITCTTPSVPDDPMDISREPIAFQVSMNGFDFQDAGKDLTFTFVGKGSGAGMIMYLLMFILLGVLFGFAAWYAYEWYKNQPNQQNQ